MPDSQNLAVDPASPDAHVEEHFFKQGVDQEGQAHDGHFEDPRGRKSRLLVAGAAVGGVACFVAAVALLVSTPSEKAAPVAAAPVPAPAPVTPPPVAAAPAPAPVLAAAVPVPPAPAAEVPPSPSPPPIAAAAVPTAAPPAPAPAVPATPPPSATALIAAAPPPPVPAAPPVTAPAPVAVTVPAATVAAAALPTAEPNTPEFATLEQTCRNAYGRRRYRDVLDSCGRAVEAKPAAGELAALVAEMEFDRGRMGQALTWARKAVAADPSVADAYVFIGGAEQQAGHADAARTAYMKYLELAPGGRYARDLRAIVKQ